LASPHADRDLPDPVFRDALLASKASRYDPLRAANEQLTAELRNLLGDMYRALPPERRTERMLSMLESDAAPVRTVAAEIVREEKAFAAVIPEQVQDRLRQMVGDSDPGVRYAVANALGALNYAPALDALLAQLPLEESPEVRAQIARALAPIHDLQAVPVLLDLLGDQDRAVVRAAALSLKDLGEKLRREGTPEMADRATSALRTVLRSTGNGAAGGEELRAAVVEAIVPLARVDLLPDLQPLLNRTEPPSVRRSALKALARIGTGGRPEIADSIVPALADRDASVRLEAARALQQLRRPELISSLLSRLDPVNEPDPTVQEAAWSAIVAQLPDAPAQRLWNILPQFPSSNERDRARRVTILLALEQKLAGQPDQLADAREDLGKTYMDAGQPANAVDYFRAALGHHRTSGTANNVARLTERLMASLLKSGRDRYADAMAFAAEAIAADPANAQVMGSAIKREAQELANAGRDADAASLINTAEALRPPLPDQYRRGLAEIQADINRRAIEGVRDGASPPRGPRSASGTRTPLVPRIL
jgi:HEAT repeat protein